MSGDTVFCPKPFEFFEVDTEGNAWVCCQDWLNKSIGNLYDKSLFEVWNSERAQDIRKSILDGSYKYCNSETCPKLVAKTLEKSESVKNRYRREIIDGNLIVLNKG